MVYSTNTIQAHSDRMIYFRKSSIIWFQETLDELFPSLFEVKRQEEVVLFTVGLMQNPSTLVDHVYHTYMERISKILKTGEIDDDNEGRLQNFGKDINDIRFFESLYKESKIRLPGTAFRIQHFNYYFEDDAEPIYLPSKMFLFQTTKRLRQANTFFLGEEIFNRATVDSIICSNQTEDDEGLLNTIRRISKLQPISDLSMFDINCENLPNTDVFYMSNKCRSIVLWDCVLPSRTLDHLVQQIANCSTLHTIDVRVTNLGDMESLSVQYLPSLTKLWLWNTNLCRFHLLHLAYLVENSKLPNLRLLDIGTNDLNSL